MTEPNMSQQRFAPRSEDSLISSGNESRDRDLNRHRGDDQRRAVAEAVVRLRARGIEIAEDERPEDVVRVLEAVETFERAVQACGGDLMVDTPPSRRPGNPRFALPRRRDDESTRDFAVRIRALADRL